MAQVIMDEELKKSMEQTEIVADPFYSKENMERLERAVADADAGRNMAERELVEA